MIPERNKPLRTVLWIGVCLLMVLSGLFAQEPADSGEATDGLPGSGANAEPSASTDLQPLGPGSSAGGVVYVIPVTGDVSPVMVMVINRALRQASKENLQALVFDMDTFGGQVDSAIRIRDRLVELDVPTLTYVNNKAISAGALIALGTDRIVMSEGSNIGAALPITIGPEGATAADTKFISVMASEMRKTAKAKGHPPDIAEAFCNPAFELEGIKEKDEILTLDYDRAVELGLAAYVAPSLDDLLASEGLDGARIETFEETPTDRFARFLVSPAVMGILMMVGVAGLFMEMKTPGVGLPGAVGAGALAIYFFGSYLAHLSGYVEIIAFVLGIGLIAVELFVIPGFGVAGIAGILLTVGALFFALFNMAPEGFDFNFRRVEVPLYTITISMVSTIPVLWMLAWILPKTPLYGHLTLAPPSHPEEDSVDTAAPAPSPTLRVGDRGRAITDLRPSGKASINDQRVDVVSEGEFLEAQSEIEIVRMEGSRIAVRAVGRA